MKLSDISIKNPVFAWMLMAGLITFGAISFNRLGISQLPDVDFPVLNISVGLEGAAPEIMETTVVDPLENALMTVEGIKSISSSSKTGTASIKVEFELEKNIDVALQDVQSKIAQTQRLLPTDIDPPVIRKTNPDDQPIMWLALTYDKNDPKFLMSYARDFIKDRFTTVPGVGDVTLGGYTDPALRVWVKPDQLRRYNMSVNDIIEAIQTEHAEMPGGVVETGTKNFNVRTLGEAKSVEEFKNIVISRRAGQTTPDPQNMVRLGQVADIHEGLDEIRRISRFNGKTALGLGIRKQRGSNAVAVAQAVKERMEEVAKQLPEGMKIQVNFDTTVFVEASIKELISHLIFAVLLTSIVCWVFLGSWSATLNVLLSIPTSIVGAFIGLYFFGFTLNTFTLLGLTLAIGIVVDDAIMVLENIFRYSEKGRSRIESAIVGAREIAFAAMAATAAVIAIFLPVVFMKGVIGKYFLQFGVTISLAVALSLLEALTITPMRCASFVSHGERTTRLGIWFERGLEALKNFYIRSLSVVMRYKWSTLTISLVFVAASFFSLRFLKKEMTPPQDMGRFIVRMTLPVGTSLTYTDEVVKKAEEIILSMEDTTAAYVAVGGFSGAISDANTALMFVSLEDKNKRSTNPETGKRMTQGDIMAIARKELSKIKDLRVFIQDLSMRGFSSGRGFPVEFTVLGSNWEELQEQTNSLVSAMEKSGKLIDIDTDYLAGMPEIAIVPDRQQAALHGISVAAIGRTVNALIGGLKVGQYPKDGQRYDVRLQLEKQDDPEKELTRLLVGNSRSNLIPLERVVEKRDRKAMQSISRKNRQRAITVYANLAQGVGQQEAMSFIESEARKILKPGYVIDQTGSSQAMNESFSSLFFALILGFAVAYMVLAAQFNSFIDPVSVLMALPFSFTGAFFALLLTGQSLNIYSLIGLLLLMGIVKKNSILLVEFTNTIRERSDVGAHDALMEACPIRLRPILMTSLATMSAAIPSALATGAGSETFKPMAITIIGGVLVSTLLTLYVVPVVYALLDRFRKSTHFARETKQAFEKVGQEAI